MKDVLTILGLDGICALVIYFIEPSYLKWVLFVGLISLLILFFTTKQGRVSIYGTQIVMALMVAIHFG